MKNVFRKAVRRVVGYVPGEQPRDRRFIKLNTNENPYPPSPAVASAIRDGLDERLRLYPAPMADELRTEASRAYRIPPDRILVGNGSDDLLTMIFRAVAEPGAAVAFPVPTYSLYDTLVELQDGETIPIPWAEGYRLPDELIDLDCRMVILANPNSPSGTLVPRADIVRLLAREDRLVVVDEAYVDFAEETSLGLVGDHPNLVVLRTLSKSFSLAGLRIGLGFGSDEVISTLAKVKDSYNVNRLSVAAGAAALRDLRSMESSVRRVCQTRDVLTSGLRTLGFDVYPSQANFVLARLPGRDLAPVHEALRKRGILVRYFPTEELRDALRVTVGTDEEIRTFLRVLGQIVRHQADDLGLAEVR